MKRSPIKRKTPVRRSNPDRKRREFTRTYHSDERVKFVRGLPCAACGVQGYSVNAHLLGNDGARRKGPYTSVGPLCDIRFGTPTVIGCHITYDLHRRAFDAAFPDFDPEKVAAETEKLWQRYTEEEAINRGG